MSNFLIVIESVELAQSLDEEDNPVLALMRSKKDI